MKGSTTMSENEIREEGALGVFRRNPYYRKLYDDAPDGAKSYYRGCFVGSLEALGDQYKGMSGEERFHAILLSLTDEDWDYLKHHAPSITIACGLHISQQAIRKEKAKMAAQGDAAVRGKGGEQ